MSFGLKTSGFDQSLSVSSEIATMVFMGKATRVTGTGLTYFGADQGATSLTCSGMGVCGGGSVTISLTPSNDNGVFTYSIASPNKPAVFINSTNVSIFGTVFGIANSGTTGANGWPLWYIKVCVSYPTGLRENALPSVSVYCFDRIPNVAPAGYGLALYNASGDLTFSSAYKPLKVKDILLISSSNTPASLGNIIYNKSYLTNPVTPALSITKPAFLNVEWGRYQVFTGGGGVNVCTQFTQIGFSITCVQCGINYANWNQTFLTGGINVNATQTDIVVNLIGQIPGAITCGNSGIPNYYIKNEALPVYIPVINGGDYD
jgi:hypothetical protein